MVLRRAVLVLALVIALPRAASAHQASLTHSQVTVDGAEVRYTILIAPGDLAEVLDEDSGYVPTPAEIFEHTLQIARYVMERIAVIGDDEPCPASAGAVDEVDDGGRFVRVQWTATCPEPVARLAIEYDLFFDLDPTHEGMLRVSAHGDSADDVLRDGASRFVWDLGEPPPSGTLAFVRSGIDHILDGTDHIAFVLALLLVVILARTPDGWRRRRLGESLRATALIVTSFTIAHTVTLISASLGWVSVPGRVVESVIAASIAYTAIENVIRPDVRWRFLLTFGFGLIHGLGFASVLQVMLPPDDVVVPLLSFNVGVELGQLFIVSLALPLYWLLCGLVGADRYRRIAMPIVSSAFALFGLVWFLDRAL
jgi:hypothetical protein